LDHPRIAIVVLTLLFGAGVRAQDQSHLARPDPPLKYSSGGSWAKGLKRTVVQIRVEYLDGDVQKSSYGTGFLVTYPDSRLPNGGTFLYLVTNRHVAQPGIEKGHAFKTVGLFVRFNGKAPNAGALEIPFPGSNARWFFPSDDSVDLAVMPISVDPTRLDVEGIPVAQFVTKDVINAMGIGEGDTVLCTGLFYQFPGQMRFEPIVRQGILAMVPEEKMLTTLNKPGDLYLADLHVFGGNSGSPVVVNEYGIRTDTIVAGVKYGFLGVISGYYFEDADMTLKIATTYEGTLRANSGVALIVPADEVLGLLNGAELQADREAYFRQQKPK
jgi:hypothetical protein